MSKEQVRLLLEAILLSLDCGGHNETEIRELAYMAEELEKEYLTL